MITNNGSPECILVYSALCTMCVRDTRHCKTSYDFQFDVGCAFEINSKLNDSVLPPYNSITSLQILLAVYFQFFICLHIGPYDMWQIVNALSNRHISCMGIDILRIQLNITPELMPKNLPVGKSTFQLVPSGTYHYLKRCPRSLTSYGDTRAHWVEICFKFI